MNILINKDIENEYKNEFIKGFTLKEAVCIAIAAVIVIGIAVYCWIKWAISPRLGCYFGLPPAALVCVIGFKKFQGLTAIQYLKEILWERWTRILTYKADETIEDPEPFTLERRGRERT